MGGGGGGGKRSTNVCVSNLSGGKILFSTFYTGLFLLFGKKKLGGTGPASQPHRILGAAKMVKWLST